MEAAFSPWIVTLHPEPYPEPVDIDVWAWSRSQAISRAFDELPKDVWIWTETISVEMLEAPSERLARVTPQTS